MKYKDIKEEDILKIEEELINYSKEIIKNFSKTELNINFDSIKDFSDNIIIDKAAEFVIDIEDLDLDSIKLTLNNLNGEFIHLKVIPDLDSSILKRHTSIVKGNYNLYVSPKYYSEVKDELNFDNNVSNIILVPITRLPVNKEYIEIPVDKKYKVNVFYKVLEDMPQLSKKELVEAGLMREDEPEPVYGDRLNFLFRIVVEEVIE